MSYSYDSLPVAVQVVGVAENGDVGYHEDDEEGQQQQQQQQGAAPPSLYATINSDGHTALSSLDSRLGVSVPAHPVASNTTGVTVVDGPVEPWRHSGGLDLIFGFMFAFVAWITTLKLEIAAFVIYALAALFHIMAEKVFGRTYATLFCKSIFDVLTAVMMIVDSVLIMVSLLVSELLGAVALFLISLFGGPRSGTEWHMFIRRTCHLTRWKFRSCLTKGWKPERIFPISESEESARLQPTPSIIGFDLPVRDSAELRSGMPDYRDHHTSSEESLRQTTTNTPPTTCACAPRSCDCVTDSVTMTHDTISTLTTATVLPADLPPVTIAAEHVHVLNGEDGNDEEDDDDGYFTKNTQQVIID